MPLQQKGLNAINPVIKAFRSENMKTHWVNLGFYDWKITTESLEKRLANLIQNLSLL